MLLPTIVSAVLLSSRVLAQSSIIPSSEPSCIQSCQVFNQAQQACAVDQGQDTLYQSCFCQSAYLSTIKSNAAQNLCPNCAAADWTTIASWYNGLCGSGGTGTGTTTTAAGAANGQTTLVTTTGPVTEGGAAVATTSSSSASATANNAYLSADDDPANWTDASSWFKTHYQWVIMIIVLAVAFAAIGIIGTIIHKRKSRSKQRGTNNTAPMTSNPAVNSWAPSRHSVHDFGTPREQSPAPPMPAAGSSNSRRESRRIGKSPLTQS